MAITLVKGENSYLADSEVNSYFNSRIDASVAQADSDSLYLAVVTATNILNTFGWGGEPVSRTQTLAYPRRYMYNKNTGRNYPSGYPKFLQDGTAELAYHFLRNPKALDDVQRKTTNVKGLIVETVPNALIPRHVWVIIEQGLRDEAFVGGNF